MKQTLLLILILKLTLVNGAIKTSNVSCANSIKTHLILENTKVADGAKMGVQPGDTVYLEAGNYPSLVMKNFNGTATNPITIINCGGQVIIDGGSYFTFSFRHSSYIHLTGTGDSSIEYGIEVRSPDPSSVGNGVGMGSFCKNIEIDHLKIHDVDFAGIMIKTDPTCDINTQRGNFVIDYINIHDNEIYNTGGEAMYLGYSTYNAVGRDCDNNVDNGKETMVLPHEILDLKIWNNKIYNTGREGIQIGCVRNYEIYDNDIRNYATAHLNSHQNAVQLGQGCAGVFRNNFIKDGFGHGLTITAHENTIIANNVIINAGINNPLTDENWGGFNPPSGINMHDNNFKNGHHYKIINNTIINPRANGVYMYGDKVPNHEIKNNVVMQAGGNFSTARYNAAFYIAYPKNVVQQKNYYGNDLAVVKFKDITQDDYSLNPMSFLTDAGVDTTIEYDFKYQSRIHGNGFDIGAFENTNQAIILDDFPENACNCDHVIPYGIDTIDGDRYNFLPGETICIEGGERDKLALKNVHGTSNESITITNCGSVVTIKNGGSIDIDAVTNIRFTGTGITSENYGFQVIDANSNALSVNELSNHFEIDHVQIINAGNYGIYSKDDPRHDLSANKGHFTLENSTIHDIEIRNSKRGIQIGHPRYQLGKVTNGDTLYPYAITNFKIKNVVLDTIYGGDGINIYGSVNTVIEDNKLTKIHGVGVYPGTHSEIKLERNIIKHTGKEGFRNTGSGSAKLYNNVFYNTGTRGNYSAIKFPFQNANGNMLGNAIDIQYNTVIASSNASIHVVTGNQATENCIVSNNVFSEPNKTLTSTSFPFVKINQQAMFTITNNNETLDVTNLYLEDIGTENFNLTAQSPVINQGIIAIGSIDVIGNPRVVGGTPDIGAFEFVSSQSNIKNNETVDKTMIIYPTVFENYLNMNTVLRKEMQYEIFDLRGKIVTSGDITNQHQRIATNAISSGMYIIRLRVDKEIISVQKIIKK